jgi:hypothetical protein
MGCYLKRSRVERAAHRNAYVANVQLNLLRPTDLGPPIYVLRSMGAAEMGEEWKGRWVGVEGSEMFGDGLMRRRSGRCEASEELR